MAYAKKIWPEKDDKNAAQTLYAMQRKSSKTGKPQGVPLHLAVLMIDLLDNAPSFPSFCFEIAEKIRLGWPEKIDAPVGTETPGKKETPQTQRDNQDRPALSSGLERAGQGNGVDTLPGTRQPL